jgi:hypothetical protein
MELEIAYLADYISVFYGDVLAIHLDFREGCLETGGLGTKLGLYSTTSYLRRPEAPSACEVLDEILSIFQGDSLSAHKYNDTTNDDRKRYAVLENYCSAVWRLVDSERSAFY